MMAWVGVAGCSFTCAGYLIHHSSYTRLKCFTEFVHLNRYLRRPLLAQSGQAKEGANKQVIS
ncbi:hypothetical protein, partial [Klebsiella variicola]